VLTPGTLAYSQSLSEYYSANAAQDAWCIVMPESTSDVQAIAQIISKENCPFGMKAGGHSAWKGSNGIKNGVTVDFSECPYALTDVGSFD
jgi:FAD/FMN-containing dehydrogenase